MKKLHSFNEFRNLKLSTFESNLTSLESIADDMLAEALNENATTDIIKRVFDKVKAFFYKVISSPEKAYRSYMAYLDKRGVLKRNGVEYIPFTGAQTVSVPSDIANIKESLNEEAVALTHPAGHRIREVDADQLAEDIGTSYELKAPIFIWGAPGIGKTDICRQVGKKYGVDVIIFNLSVRDPVDFIGLPSIDKGRTIYNVPSIFPASDSTSKGIIFFDEMNRADRSVIRASLQFVLDREIGGYKLPKGWAIIAAGNRDTEAADVEDLGSALGNRFSHVNYVPTVAHWEKWSNSEAGIDPETKVSYLNDEVLNFVKFQEKWFHNYDPESKAPAWASPRSWVQASKEYTYIKTLYAKEGKDFSDDKIESIMAKHVGGDAAREFMTFKKLIMNYITGEQIELVYTDADKAPLPPKNASSGSMKLDVAFAMMSAIAYKWKNKKMDAKNIENVFKYSARLKSMEWASAFIKQIIALHPYIMKEELGQKTHEYAVKYYQGTYGHEFSDEIK